MRISSWMLHRDALRTLGGNLEALARAQRESTTGRRVQTVSDDPAAASRIMRLDAHLRDIEQFRKNAAVANTRLSAEDVVLQSARDLVQRARDVMLSGATESRDSDLRQQALDEVEQIRNQLIALGNTKLGDEFIFGGGQTANPPFRVDGTYVGDGTVRQVTIDDRVTIETNHTGDRMLSSALQALAGAVAELRNGTPESIRQQAQTLDAAQQDVLSAQVEAGARLKEIKEVGDLQAARVNTITDSREALRDVDPTEAALKVMAAQTALERSYAVVGRVLSINLVDFLK